MIPDIIILCGKKHSGKTEVAKVIATKIGRYSIVKESDPVKKMVYEFLIARGCNAEIAREYSHGSLKDTPTRYFNMKTSRDMQKAMCEAFRAMDEDFIAIVAADKVEEHIASGGQVIIDDVRDKREISMIADVARRRNASMVKLWVYDPCNIHNNDHHITETRVSAVDCDAEILNLKTGTDDLCSVTRTVLNSLSML